MTSNFHQLNQEFEIYNFHMIQKIYKTSTKMHLIKTQQKKNYLDNNCGGNYQKMLWNLRECYENDDNKYKTLQSKARINILINQDVTEKTIWGLGKSKARNSASNLKPGIKLPTVVS